MSTGFTAQGWSRIPFIDGPLCDGCGTPFEYDLGEGVRCADCMAKPRAFSRGRAACLYDDASRGVILQLKHADRTDLAPMLARWISRSARDLLEDADAVTGSLRFSIPGVESVDRPGPRFRRDGRGGPRQGGARQGNGRRGGPPPGVKRGRRG